MPNPNKTTPIHGWLILDKPKGLTSTQALGQARRLIGGKKVGHMGTLDPMATGILPLAFGEATKMIPYIQDGEKEYEFTIRWGIKTDSDDAEGEVVAETLYRPREDELFDALSYFIGKITQIPPAYSAIKINGQRAYDLARAGKAPEMKPRQVQIHSLDLIRILDHDHAAFRVSCGAGTYVRALGRDLAETLGTYGHLTVLRRTKVGKFTLESAISLEKLEDLSHKEATCTALVPIGSALDDIPGLTLNASDAQILRAGGSLIVRPDQMDLLEAPIIMAQHQGTPVALVKAKAGSFVVVRGFNF